MRFLTLLLLAAVALAVLRALMIVLALTIVVLLLWGALTRPAETLGLLLVGLVASALQAFPFIVILLLAAFLAAAAIRHFPIDAEVTNANGNEQPQRE